MGQLRSPGNRHSAMNQLDLCGSSGLAPFYLSMSRGLDILLAHNQWSNKLLLEDCRPLTTQQFHQPFPMGPAERGGLHLTITHIISASGRWADPSVSNRGLRAGLVGTPDQVAERVAEFEKAGVGLLLLQCSPQLEEMERFSEAVINQ